MLTSLCLPIEDSPRNWGKWLVQTGTQNGAGVVLEPTIVSVLALSEELVGISRIIPAQGEN